MSAAELAAFAAELRKLLETDPAAATDALMRAFLEGRISEEQLAALLGQFLDDPDLSALVKVNLAAALVAQWPKDLPRSALVRAAIGERILPYLREVWTGGGSDFRQRLQYLAVLGLVATPDGAAFAREIFDGPGGPPLKHAVIAALGEMRTTDANRELLGIMVADTAGAYRDLTYRTLLGSIDAATLEGLWGVIDSPDATAAELAAAYDIIASTLNRQAGRGAQAGLADPRLAAAVGKLAGMYSPEADINTRRMILSALGEISGPAALDALTTVLHRETNQYLLDAAALNLSIGGAAGHELLARTLESPSASVDARLAAWQHFGAARLAALSRTEGGDAGREALLHTARTLAQLAFQSGTDEQRILAAQRLAGLPDERLVNTFLGGLTANPSPRVAIVVGNAVVEKWRTHPAVAPQLGTTVFAALEHAVAQPSLSPGERIAGMRAIARVDMPRAAPLYASIVEQPGNAWVRRTAVRLLIRTGSVAHRGLISGLASSDGDAEVRRLCAEAASKY